VTVGGLESLRALHVAQSRPLIRTVQIESKRLGPRGGRTLGFNLSTRDVRGFSGLRGDQRHCTPAGRCAHHGHGRNRCCMLLGGVVVACKFLFVPLQCATCEVSSSNCGVAGAISAVWYAI